MPTTVSASRRRSRHGGLRTGTLAAVVGMLLWVLATPASAHNALIGSTPAADAVLERAPASVTLQFNQVVGANLGTVVVTGPDGADWADGPVKPVDTTAVQALRAGGPAGLYQVAYRVVSADGHPVTGTLAYTVEAAPQAVAGTTPAPAAPASAPAEATSGSADDDRARDEQAAASSSVGVATVAIVAVATVVLVAGLGLLLRRRRARVRGPAAVG